MNSVYYYAKDSTSVSFCAKGSKAVFVQNLVKRFDGRFKTNYTLEGGEQYIRIEFKNSDNFIRFNQMLRIVQMKYF